MEEHLNDSGKKVTKNSLSKVFIYLFVAFSVLFVVVSFFSLITTLSKPQTFDLGVVDPKNKQKITDVEVDPERTITLLVDNAKIIRYIGTLESPLEKAKEFEYGENGIRKELLRLKSSISKEGKDRRIVLIKMTKNLDYQRMVDILDEMAVSKVPTYALVDITPKEEALLSIK